MVSSKQLCAVILLVFPLTFSAAQKSCKGRCGVEYYRGYMCQCDYNCLSYGECCRDYESQCTTKNSCLGRCGEAFNRGRLCSCDSDCVKYNQCCSDYKAHCEAVENSGAASETAPVKTSSCDNVNDSKHKEPEETEQPSLTDENNADDYSSPVDGPTSDPEYDYNDAVYSQAPSTDEFSISGGEDLEASPIPESTSGYGPSTADPLDQVPTEPGLGADAVEITTEEPFSYMEPTLSDDDNLSSLNATSGDVTSAIPADPLDQDPTEPGLVADVEITTAATFSHTEPTPSDDENLSGLNATSGDVTSAITDTGDLKPPSEEVNPPQLTTTADLDSDQFNSTSMPQTAPTLSTTEINTNIPPLDEPQITINSTNESNTDLEFSQVSTSPASSTLASTAIPEEATTIPSIEIIETFTTPPPSLLADPEDPSSTVPPAEAGDGSRLHDVSTQIRPVQNDTTDGAKPEVPTADPLMVALEITSPPTSKPTEKPQDKPKPHKPQLSSKPETKPLHTQTFPIDNQRDYQADDSNDTDLCSGRPVSGVTTLRNGTTVVFRGHYFWLLDRNRVPSSPQGITQVWGVPSPIDTVFTRCNCHGKTYIFKGGKYWRFENDVLDTGYPKLVRTGFDGLRGHITAALSVPQYRNRRESVFFFKRGGYVQKYSYLYGTSPSCEKKLNIPIYTVQARRVRRAVSVLEPAIKIQTSWPGFPYGITAAVSVPNKREPEGYKYFVFTRSKSYNVRMAGQRPAVAAPKAQTPPQNNNFFRCPSNS